MVEATPGSPKTPDIDKTLSAMTDSVNLITKLIAAKVVDKQGLDTIDRNVKHLDLMVGKDFVKNAGKDLKSYTDASAAGKDYQVANPAPAAK